MRYLNTLEFVGASLTVIGGFLPWERSGGFFDFYIYGIRIDLANFKYWVTGIHKFPVYDYGGGLLILLSSVIILLAHRPPTFIRNPVAWSLIVSSALMAFSLYFLGRGLLHVLEFPGVVEQPTIQPGLICVVLGSVLLLWKAVSVYNKAANREIRSAA